MSSVLADVAGRVQRGEGRLERLLASGWPTAAAEASVLEEDATALDELGLPALAVNVRRVSLATTGAEALPAIAVALAACRQVRARLASAEALDASAMSAGGEWAPLMPS